MLTHYITPNWNAPTRIKAFTTTRHGGFSQAPFTSFNLGSHVADDPIAVTRNREKLMHDLQLPHAPTWLNQVHGIKTVAAPAAECVLDADACYTRSTNKVCAVLTADCLPILICNQQGTEVAAIHAGWRGLLNGVIDSALAQLQSERAELIAWLGPAIGPEVFELNEEIRLDFIRHNPDNSSGFCQKLPKHWFADLYELARINLKRCGVGQIFGGDFCTYQDSANFYSHRRDQGHTGRMATLIWIQD